MLAISSFVWGLIFLDNLTTMPVGTRMTGQNVFLLHEYGTIL